MALDPRNDPNNEPVVPNGWAAKFDPEYKTWFYVERDSKKSQWEAPPGAKFKDADGAVPPPYSPDTQSRQANAVPPQASGQAVDTRQFGVQNGYQNGYQGGYQGGYAQGYGGYPQQYGGYPQQYPPQQYPPQQYQQQRRSGMGAGTGMAMGAGAGMLGGFLLADAMHDSQMDAYQDGYQDGAGGDYGGGDFGGGDFGGDF